MLSNMYYCPFRHNNNIQNLEGNNIQDLKYFKKIIFKI